MSLSKLGRFEILREIGKGAMGQVFLARDPKIERQVAIKTIVLPPGTSVEEAHETSQRFVREAQAAGKLLHPNIVTIFDVGEESGTSFIAMEFIEGETLEKYARAGSLLPLGRVLDLVSQAATALDYAHQNSVIHRDIKPANLMVLKDGTLKITDFGLAKNPSANLTQAGVLLGTPSYMSPEQIQGSDLTGRSDLFSLGVVLYELLTGVRPFEGESISTIIYRVLYEEPRPPAALNAALPPELNLVIEKVLAKDPQARYARGTDLVADLRKALASLPPDTLSRPLPATVRAAVPPRAGGSRPTERHGGKGRGRRVPPGGPAPPETRATLLLHQPLKIATVIGAALLGMVLFPRWVNRHEPSPDLRAGRTPPGGIEERPIAPAGIGAPPSPNAGRAAGGGQVAVDIETIPHGASILLDTTPLAEPRVVLSLTDPQPHDIVAQAGCRRAVAEMTAADLASFKGSLVLELAPRKEEVRIGSEPAGARILVNDRDTGKQTPADVLLAACEPRTVTLRRDGYRPWSGSYDSDDEFDAMVAALGKVALEPIPRGTLLVRRSKDFDLEVFDGDRRIGRAGEPIELLEGKHTLTLRSDAVFVRETLHVTVSGGVTTTPNITFPALGTITVQAQPSNCKVYIDGHYVDVTPVLALPIASGGHRVKVVFVPNGAVKEIPVTVDAGKDARVVVKF